MHFKTFVHWAILIIAFLVAVDFILYLSQQAKLEFIDFPEYVPARHMLVSKMTNELLPNTNMPNRKVFTCDQNNNVTTLRREISKETESIFLNQPRKKTEVFDLDLDKVEEVYSLNLGRLSIDEGGERRWYSPPSWWIEDFFYADLNNDYQKELILLTWKVKNMDVDSLAPTLSGQDLSNHLMLVSLVDNVVNIFWQEQNEPLSYCEILPADVNNDGWQELVAIIGQNTVNYLCESRKVAIAEWQSSSFHFIWQEDVNLSRHLEAWQDGNQTVIQIQTVD